MAGTAMGPTRDGRGSAPLKIGIAHRAIIGRDAIGNDILGMHRVLSGAGFDTCLVGEYFGPELSATVETMQVVDAIDQCDLDLLIYHHSIFWEKGEILLRLARMPRLVKYHNITPAEFFAAYSEHYVELCQAGRLQTKRLVRLLGAGDRFAADSAYNAHELSALGAPSVAIAPPFTEIAVRQHDVLALPTPPYHLLFIGRLAPNKGHFALLDTIAAYVAAHGPQIRLDIVGGTDDRLEGYYHDLEDQVDRLQIRDQIVFHGSVDGAALRRLFAAASAYLCLSEHEGFCVPVIEAQAMGIPVVAADAAALGETIGPDQLVVAPPRTPCDFLHVARLIHAVSSDAPLRQAVIRAGYRNVLMRFAPDLVADRFMTALLPLLETAP
jgi:glycosyltransferase involved in cell wall biosynthesis